MSALAPSWSHGSKSKEHYIGRPVIRWLPRGAMDLNFQVVEFLHRYVCWLPRGAMDLNGNKLVF